MKNSSVELHGEFFLTCLFVIVFAGLLCFYLTARLVIEIAMDEVKFFCNEITIGLFRYSM